MHERRAERRHRVLKEAEVWLTDRIAVNCVVRDLSPGGARLEFEGPVCLPSEFRLHIVSADLTIPAAPVWLRKLEAGIRFTGVGTAGTVDNSPQKCPTVVEGAPG
jgi:hypothetical protein